jgi:hypothetical protein
LIEPEDDGRGDADGRHEVARAAIVGLNVCFAPEAAFQKVPLLIASTNRDESRWE